MVAQMHEDLPSPADTAGEPLLSPACTSASSTECFESTRPHAHRGGGIGEGRGLSKTEGIHGRGAHLGALRALRATSRHAANIPAPGF
jgi:hypothetical protein